LSARSRRLRFPTPKTALSPAELRYFTDVDHHDDRQGRGPGTELMAQLCQ
jgi:hypothetical protein